MEETVIRPRTIMEVFKMLPETTLAEVINKRLFMSPAPIGRHQRTIRKLISQMADHVETRSLGEVFVSPLDVYLDEHSNAVQPDIFFITTERLDIVDDEGGVHGVPDLIVEILSPGNPKHDKVTKKGLYQKFKVKEYWVIDPATRKANGFSLSGNSYKPLLESTGKISSLLLNGTFKF